MISFEKIRELLDPYDDTQTECNGLTRICLTILTKSNVEHQPMIGVLVMGDSYVKPHFWIDLPSGHRIDYRAKMWLGDSDNVPHGVFEPEDFPEVIYVGEPVELGVLPPAVFDIMTLKVDWGKVMG